MKLQHRHPPLFKAPSLLPRPSFVHYLFFSIHLPSLYTSLVYTPPFFIYIHITVLQNYLPVHMRAPQCHRLQTALINSMKQRAGLQGAQAKSEKRKAEGLPNPPLPKKQATWIDETGKQISITDNEASKTETDSDASHSSLFARCLLLYRIFITQNHSCDWRIAPTTCKPAWKNSSQIRHSSNTTSTS